ncbi:MULTISPECIES: hypothetical protein [unclassified Brenneria]|uniref:hypothetical protein n=1 Tax=unclassified Brenneria TaxID=2634434 RepID=UPI0029C272CD|nr:MULTISPECIES: hypothetical protein [unclassified Brenneria]MDX5627347.1 hypothetical protein [Brenneria sp. L3-3Z]MDX5694497.1 hypothetical protein [Brenneria sp. L4-2C]MEE3661879.1 hypothetical protein [Brenneria sp. g21c3]
MSEISSLSLKIPVDLKEKIKAAALEKGVSISAEVSARLLQSFGDDGKANSSSAEAVDNQDIKEGEDVPLTPKEIKKIRALLKDKTKNASKKK